VQSDLNQQIADRFTYDEKLIQILRYEKELGDKVVNALVLRVATNEKLIDNLHKMLNENIEFNNERVKIMTNMIDAHTAVFNIKYPLGEPFKMIGQENANTDN
jgi:hypothetical protein